MKKVLEKPIGFKQKCWFCGCTFSYESSDLRGGLLNPIVDCPECNTALDHEHGSFEFYYEGDEGNEKIL